MPNGGIWAIPTVNRQPIKFGFENWGPTTGLAEFMRYRQMQLRAAAAAARASTAGHEGDPRFGAYATIPAADGSGKEERIWIEGKEAKERQVDYQRKYQQRVADILANDKPLQEHLKDFPNLSVEGQQEKLSAVRGEVDRLAKAVRMDSKELMRNLTRDLSRSIQERQQRIDDAGVFTQATEGLGTGVADLVDEIAMWGESGAERIARGKIMNARREKSAQENTFADELMRREKEGRSNFWYMLKNPVRTALLKAGELLPELGTTLAAQVGGAAVAGPLGFMAGGALAGGLTAGGEQVRRLAADPNLTDEEKAARADAAFQQGAAIGAGVGAIPAGPSVALSRGLMRRQANKLMAATPTLAREEATKQAMQNAVNADAKRTLAGRAVRAYPGIAADAATLGIAQQIGQNVVHGNITGQPINYGEGLTEQGLAGLITAIPLAPFAARRARAMPGSTQRRIEQEGIKPETPPEKAPATDATAEATEAPAAEAAPMSGVEYARSRFARKGGYPNNKDKFVKSAIDDIEAGKMTLAEFEAAAEQHAQEYKAAHPKAKSGSWRYVDAQEAIKQYKEKHPDAEPASTSEENAGRATTPVGEAERPGEGGADNTNPSPDSTATARAEAATKPASDGVFEPTPRDGATPQERGDDGTATPDTRPTEADAGATLKPDAAAGEPVRDGGVEPTAAKRPAAGEGNGGGESPTSAGRPRAQDAEATGSGEHLNAAEVDKAAQRMETKLAAGKGVVIDPATPKAAEAAPVESAPAKTKAEAKAKSSTGTKAAAKRKTPKAEAVGEDGNVHVREDEVADLPSADELAANDATELTPPPAQAVAEKPKSKKTGQSKSRKKVADTAKTTESEVPELGLADSWQLAAVRENRAFDTLDTIAKLDETRLIGSSKESVFKNKGYSIGQAVIEGRRALFDAAWTGKPNAVAKKLYKLGVPEMKPISEKARASIEKARQRQKAITGELPDAADVVFPKTGPEAEAIIRKCVGVS